MKTTVTILKDIQMRANGHVFHRRSSEINYDSRLPRDKKLHQLLFQQGDYYGEVGDCCEYITHELLLELERGGFVRIEGFISR
jgi:hypothetical protein